VLAVERTVGSILEWSNWQRWHQAWARYYHYRRRHGIEPGHDNERAGVQPIDVTDVVWSRLELLLPPVHRVGRPYSHARRLVLEAIVYVMQTNCGWGRLPSSFPPWQTVYAQLCRWRKTGIWDKIWSGLDRPHSTGELQL
jgi:transposase